MKSIKNLALLALVAVAILIAGLAWPAAAQNVACYMSQGGASWVAGSGCTWNVQSGGALQVDSGATVSGVMRYPTPQIIMNCGTSTITDTVTYTSSTIYVSTPVWGQATLRGISGDAARVAINVATPGSAIITVRNSNATPAANSAGAVVNWCVGGTR